MYEIDGAAGGGQMVRTAVTLSALSGEPIRIENVRGERSTPGMRPQHLAAVEATAALCDATVEGNEPDSETLVFDPGDVRASDVAVDIGTAGSIALVFGTVLPLATAFEEPAEVTVAGGTDVEWAPPLDYLRYVKLPLLSAAGLDADIDVDARGFYPVGGGSTTLTLGPSTLSPLSLTDRGELHRVEIYSTADTELEEADVAERQAVAAAKNAGVDAPIVTQARYADADSAGSALVVVAVYENTRAGFSALGEAGKPSEEVAADAVADFQRFHEGHGAVDRHLADQLLLYTALSGGEVYAPELTAHIETNRAVLETFGYGLSIEEHESGILIRG